MVCVAACVFLRFMDRCSEVDKFLLTYVILKLKLIKGKCIIFVNDVDRSYRLKLFLEQFSIKSCVLNSELPLNSRYRFPSLLRWVCLMVPRYHTVQEFNKGVYDYIIATDESGAHLGEQDTDSEDDDDEEEENEEGECMSHPLMKLFGSTNTVQSHRHSECRPRKQGNQRRNPTSLLPANLKSGNAPPPHQRRNLHRKSANSKRA